uniref:Secreted protein n=1 Tax=Scophthalmus maximus TaxID=52904 RepID=A0A8D3BUJ1_SCOMX
MHLTSPLLIASISCSVILMISCLRAADEERGTEVSQGVNATFLNVRFLDHFISRAHQHIGCSGEGSQDASVRVHTCAEKTASGGVAV